MGLVVGRGGLRTACSCFGGSGLTFIIGAFREEGAAFGVSLGLMEGCGGIAEVGDMIPGFLTFSIRGDGVRTLGGICLPAF